MTAIPIRLEGDAHFDLGSIDRIPPGEGQTFLVAGREIAVFRARGTDTVHATQARCPHKAGLLADGIVGDGKVICPLHSYRFDLATGAALDGVCGALATYHTAITDDRRVLLWLSSARRWSAG